ncbi:MAG TPA: DUF6496 domain-containing protein [Thermoanaerobaculia bacterium]|nr:DUF6496 domain-containing protein [Thermoanaerobaculia bacterium]
MASRYGKKASDKVEAAMHERKKGTLRSGSTGKKVTSKKQAIAIGLSEARREGGKVPSKKSSSKKATSSKKASSSKKATGSKKSSSTKKAASAKKATTKKSTSKKSTAKKSSSKSSKRK